jgi:hypothetical protein
MTGPGHVAAPHDSFLTLHELALDDALTYTTTAPATATTPADDSDDHDDRPALYDTRPQPRRRPLAPHRMGRTRINTPDPIHTLWPITLFRCAQTCERPGILIGSGPSTRVREGGLEPPRP